MSESTISTTDIVIIGAGMTGLMAARQLEAAGKEVIVLDKGRSVGGRMATRRMANATVDHGAQFFTVRTPEFQKHVDAWIDAGIVFMWSMGFSDGSISPVTDDGHARYAAHGGMNALAKWLAQDLKSVRTGVAVERVAQFGSRWHVFADNGRAYHANMVLMTAPVPQSLAMLDAGNIKLTPEKRGILESIEYEPCLTGLFVVSDNANLPEPGAVQRRDAAISWMANNKQKGISENSVITVQADGITSAQLWEADDERILRALRTDLLVYLPDDVKIHEEQLKRWRYSRPKAVHPAPYLRGADYPPLFFAGDAFGGPRVEGAVLSGLAVSEAMIGL